MNIKTFDEALDDLKASYKQDLLDEYYEGYKFGREVGDVICSYQLDRNANACTNNVKADIVRVIAEEVSNYARDGFADGYLTVDAFIAVSEVAIALDNVSKKLRD